MKKIIVMSFLMLGSIFAFSQVSAGIGLKGGANFATASVSNVNSDGITSYHVGMYALIKITNIGIQPEVLFSKQGISSDTKDLNLDYVNIPIMVKLYLPLGLNIQAGPQFGILTKAEEQSINVKNTFKKTDISGALGVGWDAPFGLQLNARYILGISNISEGNRDFKNKLFQLSIGYTLIKFGR